MTYKSPKYTPKQIAQLKTDRILDGARTSAIIKLTKANNTSPEEVFNQVLIKVVNLVKQVYDLLGMEETFEEEPTATVLRGYVSCIQEDYNNPWYSEWDTYFTNWKTIEDVVKAILVFHNLEMEDLFRNMEPVDRPWLTQHMAETDYLLNLNLVGTAQKLANLKERLIANKEG